VETEILYQQGLARALEVSDANGRRFDAEVNRATAKLSMQQAYLDLREALGLGPIGEELEPSPAAAKAAPGPPPIPPFVAPKGGTP
jgi:outer membrane protein TolC